MRIDSPIRRDCLELEVKSILKSEKEMLALQREACLRMEDSWLEIGSIVRWLTPMWSQLRTRSKRVVHLVS